MKSLKTSRFTEKHKQKTEQRLQVIYNICMMFLPYVYTTEFVQIYKISIDSIAIVTQGVPGSIQRSFWHKSMQ